MEALLHDPSINKDFFKIVPVTIEGMKLVHARERAELLQEQHDGGAYCMGIVLAYVHS